MTENKTGEQENADAERQSAPEPAVIEHYIKPPFGEQRLVYILDIRPGIVCWLPGLHRTLYMKTLPRSDEFKRIRLAVLIDIYDWTGSEKGVVELSAEEYKAFRPVYETYLRTGGEMYYYREKAGRKIRNEFCVRPGTEINTVLRKGVLSEKL